MHTSACAKRVELRLKIMKKKDDTFLMQRNFFQFIKVSIFRNFIFIFSIIIIKFKYLIFFTKNSHLSMFKNNFISIKRFNIFDI